MKILLAVDSSASFTDPDQWEHLKKVVNETVNALSNFTEVTVAKVGMDLRIMSLDTFNEGWNFETGDGGGLKESVLNGLDYDKVLFVTDGHLDQKALDNYVSVMILEDPAYVEDPNPIVGFLCSHCGKEKGLHQAKGSFCPQGKGYFSKTVVYSPNATKPIRRFVL